MGKMELLAPAGNLEKLATAYRYGADAAYIGVHGFSLRTWADAANLTTGDPAELAAQLQHLKGTRRLYAALNLYAHHHDLAALPPVLERLALQPLDGIILADVGLIDMVRTALPKVELHLSTQANCTNGAAARVYQRLGFSRIVPARELTLDEIRALKDAAPDLEVEVFVHGAMCMAYSGRCLLSSHMAGRDANRGDCAQSCRWDYRVEQFRMEESKRPGTWIPVEADGRFTTILSARDLNLFHHLDALKNAGVDAVKIEGRMKSAYYVAAVTRAYRAAIDAVPGWERHSEELERISHREYTTGFLLGDPAVHHHNRQDTPQEYRLMGIVEERLGDDPPGEHQGERGNEELPGVRRTPGTTAWRVHVKNSIHAGRPLEFLPLDPAGPTHLTDSSFTLRDIHGTPVRTITNAHHGIIETTLPLEEGMIIRGARPPVENFPADHSPAVNSPAVQ